MLHAFQNCGLLRVGIKLAAFLSFRAAFGFICECKGKKMLKYFAMLSLVSYFYFKMRFIPSFVVHAVQYKYQQNIRNVTDASLESIALRNLPVFSHFASFSKIIFFMDQYVLHVQNPEIRNHNEKMKSTRLLQNWFKKIYIMVTYYLLKLLLRNDY